MDWNIEYSYYSEKTVYLSIIIIYIAHRSMDKNPKQSTAKNKKDHNNGKVSSLLVFAVLD